MQKNVLTGNLVNGTQLDGIQMSDSDNNTIEGSSLKGNAQNGIHLIKCRNSSITNNNASNNSEDGLSLEFSEHNFIGNNRAEKNTNGIDLYNSSHNILIKNIASNNSEKGMLLLGSTYNSLHSNIMDGNKYNLDALGENGIDKSNLVNGRPVYYLVGDSDKIISNSSKAGVVYCINCRNITVENLALNGNAYEIFLYNTSDSIVRHNYLTLNSVGIGLIDSTNNALIENTADNNTGGFVNPAGFGIFLMNSSRNHIEHNQANYNSKAGISLWSSECNTITNSTFDNNMAIGISLSDFGNNNNTISFNAAKGNSYCDIYIGESSDGNVLLMNDIDGNERQSIIDRGSGNKLNNDPNSSNSQPKEPAE